MSLLSLLFPPSPPLLQSAYEILTQEYGYSSTSVFAMAIAATILVGFGIGAVSVCVCAYVRTYMHACVHVCFCACMCTLAYPCVCSSKQLLCTVMSVCVDVCFSCCCCLLQHLCHLCCASSGHFKQYCAYGVLFNPWGILGRISFSRHVDGMFALLIVFGLRHYTGACV